MGHLFPVGFLVMSLEVVGAFSPLTAFGGIDVGTMAARSIEALLRILFASNIRR